MDSIDMEKENLKTEKRDAMLRYRRLRNIRNLFRFFEVCLVLIFLSWFSTRLPIAVKISGEYFKDVCIFVVSPRFVFLVGNAIILTLFAKSGQFPSRSTNGSSTVTDLYDDYIRSSEKCQKVNVYEGKQQQIDNKCEESPVTDQTAPVTDSVTLAMGDTKIYRRSQSVNLNHSISERSERDLRRTETDICRKNVEIHGKILEKKKKKKKKCFGDEKEEEEMMMSNEEFQIKIEAFIAKQMRFHKEESMAIVLQNQSRNSVRSREIKI